jgi:hypothetical protein
MAMTKAQIAAGLTTATGLPVTADQIDQVEAALNAEGLMLADYPAGTPVASLTSLDATRRAVKGLPKLVLASATIAETALYWTEMWTGAGPVQVGPLVAAADTSAMLASEPAESARNLITPSADVVALRLKRGGPLESANLMEVLNSSSQVKALIDATGRAEFSRVKSANVTFYGALSTAPTGTLLQGDMYFDTVLDELMVYDSSRSKWLSVALHAVHLNYNGTCAVDGKLRGYGGMPTVNSRGPHTLKGTIVALGISKSDANASTIRVINAGSTAYDWSISAASGHQEKSDADVDVSSGNITVQNKGAASIANVQFVAYIRRRR